MIGLGWGPAYLFRNIFYANAWSKINDSKRTLIWFRFTKAFRDKKGGESFSDEEIYKLLKTKVDANALAITFESLKRIPDLKNPAESLQMYQFKQWIKLGEVPDHIKAVFSIPRLAIAKPESDDIIVAFKKVYDSGH